MCFHGLPDQVDFKGPDLVAEITGIIIHSRLRGHFRFALIHKMEGKVFFCNYYIS
jgi:hypothetical protein